MQGSIHQFFINNRLPLVLIINLAVTCLALSLSLLLRFDFDFSVLEPKPGFILPLCLMLLLRTVTYAYFQLNQGIWKYSSTIDLVKILKAHSSASILFTAGILLLRVPFPRSVIIIEWTLSILLSGGIRFLSRLYAEKIKDLVTLNTPDTKKVVVLGAGDSGHLLVKNLLSKNRIGYLPVVILDDSERMQGRTVFGVSVRGPISSLSYVLESSPRIGAVLLAIPSLSKTKVKELREVCERFEVIFKQVQNFEDIACQEVSLKSNTVTIESILNKETDVEHELEIREKLGDKRILITGAGGSIGSELVRQVLDFKPSEITLVDSSEFNLYKIETELECEELESQTNFYLANVGDKKRLELILAKHKPHVVFHAAAYKHVPLVEKNSYEAFCNNVLGTKNLLETSLANGVQKFVLISTDKAVRPSSLMGCSKRLAELLTQEFARRHTDKGFNTSVVRFGNVINSAGSVVPKFKEQILSGSPITVTHPEMERYFMSIREAVRLVLTAGILGQAGEIHILDMGKPIRIVDVAKKMRALFGRRDIPIVFTGIRPGEKLTEELFRDQEFLEQTSFNKVRRVANADFPAERFSISEWVDDVFASISKLSEEEVCQQIKLTVKFFDDLQKEEGRRRTVNGAPVARAAG